MSDNSDSYSNNSSNDYEKKKIRRNKKIFYEKERNNIFQQIKILMNMDDDNTILLVKLQDNQELKNKLNEMSNDIKKYYRCSTWGYFVSINNNEKGDEISLLKAIFKDHDFTIFSKDITSEYNNIKKRYTKLFFTK
jgi:hypothetical protein